MPSRDSLSNVPDQIEGLLTQFQACGALLRAAVAYIRPAKEL